jgi:hypothetical protein
MLGCFTRRQQAGQIDNQRSDHDNALIGFQGFANAIEPIR